MDKNTKIYIVAFVLLILGYIYLESTKKQPVNWFPSYAAKHKIPYGTFVLEQELKNLFPSTEIKTVDIPPYIYLGDSTRVGTYFFADEALNFGDAEFFGHDNNQGVDFKIIAQRSDYHIHFVYTL